MKTKEWSMKMVNTRSYGGHRVKRGKYFLNERDHQLSQMESDKNQKATGFDNLKGMEDVDKCSFSEVRGK